MPKEYICCHKVARELFLRNRQLIFVVSCSLPSGKARVVTLPKSRRLTFRDAIRYSNHVLAGQVRQKYHARRKDYHAQKGQTQYTLACVLSETRKSMSRDELMLEGVLTSTLCSRRQTARLQKSELTKPLVHRTSCIVVALPPVSTSRLAQVVLLSNSDIVFDESLARLGDPSTLDMAQKVNG